MKKIIGIVVIFSLMTGIWAQESDFQISFITPLGTNGLESHLYTNKISLNVLGGYSKANTVFEMSSLYSINFGYTQGFQGAGLFIYTGESRKAVHIAGLANIALSGSSFIQGAGIANVSRQVSGLQVSGIVNLADTVTGLQAAPLFNIAKSVKGVQVGLFNYAEEIDGIPFGMLSVVKNGGKKEVEVSFSEALNTTIGFKIGVDTFYTVISYGTHYASNSAEFAPGFGIGTQLNWNKGWGNQIEAHAFYLTEDAQYQSALNMLTQLKLLTTKTLIKGLNVFAGPTWNMTISNYKDSNGNFAQSISPWSIWKNDSNTVHLNMWIGVSAGLSYRF